MKKNVASQKIGAQMISSSDGSAFTGTVTAYVCGDAGTQAIGSVGSGVCTHEGNGYHTYTPSQAETDYDLIAFTFIGTGAIAATIQVFTDFPQTGDSFAVVNSGTFGNSNLKTVIDAGFTAGAKDATVSKPGTAQTITAPADMALNSTVAKAADLTIVDTVVDAIKVQTDKMNFTGTDIKATLDSETVVLTDGSLTAAKIAADAITAAKVATDAVTEIQNGLATTSQLETKIPTNLSFTGADVNATMGTIPAGIALEASVQEVLTQVDKIVFDHLITYVDKTRLDDSGDGFSRATAKKSINAALAIYTANNCRGTCYVARGEYFENFVIPRGVTLQATSFVMIRGALPLLEPIAGHTCFIQMLDDSAIKGFDLRPDVGGVPTTSDSLIFCAGALPDYGVQSVEIANNRFFNNRGVNIHSYIQAGTVLGSLITAENNIHHNQFDGANATDHVITGIWLLCLRYENNTSAAMLGDHLDIDGWVYVPAPSPILRYITSTGKSVVIGNHFLGVLENKYAIRLSHAAKFTAGGIEYNYPGLNVVVNNNFKGEGQFVIETISENSVIDPTLPNIIENNEQWSTGEWADLQDQYQDNKQEFVKESDKWYFVIWNAAETEYLKKWPVYKYGTPGNLQIDTLEDTGTPSIRNKNEA